MIWGSKSGDICNDGYYGFVYNVYDRVSLDFINYIFKGKNPKMRKKQKITAENIKYYFPSTNGIRKYIIKTC